MAVSAFWGLGGGGLEWEGMKVYPGDDKWGNRTLAGVAAHHGEGLENCQIITLMDVWVLDKTWPKDMRLACWTPVDHEPCPTPVRGFFAQTGATPIAMSRFGETELRKAGFDPLYVPHAVDTTLFKPGESARGDLGLPADAFVVGMVAANKGGHLSRKSFPQVFQAFARFRETHRDAILYLHTERFGKSGINLPALARACGIPEQAVRYSDPLTFELGMSDELVAGILNSIDVLASPSMGEGFGIPIIEAQACGVPVIVTNHSAMTELCGAGWVVDGEKFWDPPQEAWFKSPNVGEITHAFEAAYEESGGLSEQARRFSLAYDVETVTEDFWQPVLERLELGVREAPPLVAA